jgi:acyl-CoA hydrolase
MAPTPALPDFLARRVLPHRAALERLVLPGTRLASGFATSEPASFYAALWDHVRRHDLHDLEIRQALFMAAHPLLVGEELAQRSASRPEPPAGHSIFRAIRRQVAAFAGKAEALAALIRHYEELRERRIRFVSAFLSPANNIVVPDTLLTDLVVPEWSGRNSVRAGVTAWQSVHFPDAPDALLLDEEGRLAVHLYVLVMTPPDARGRLSHGVANGANAEALELVLARGGKVLLYVNPRYPFVEGHPESPNTIDAERLRPAAEDGRLTIVADDAAPPALPAGSFADPDPAEQAIAERVVEHIEAHLELTRGRALQVGIGGTGVLAVRRLADSGWDGRVYTEMLEPYTLALHEAGKLAGSHFVTADGRRERLDGKIVCTFALGVEGTDFYTSLDRHPALLMSAARRVVVPEAFYFGLGINNVLGIDFYGHVNCSGRDLNPYSGVGGSATIVRGLARGGIAYLCLKSTHRSVEGERRSSIFPLLPRGTPVSLVGPDLMGTREGARFFLATEHGIAPINARPQDELIKSLLSVAHPDFREDLEREAWELFRVRA